MTGLATDERVEARIADLGRRYRVERKLCELLNDKLRRRARGDRGVSGVSDIGSRLHRFLAGVIEGTFAIENLQRMAGGGSNASYCFTLVRSGLRERVVLRVKQPGTIETYVPREFQMMVAVQELLPVPKPYWVTNDSRWFGAPALICGFVDGVQAPPSDVVMATGIGAVYGEKLRKIIAPQFVAYEAKLHAFDWSKCDLSLFDIPNAGTTEAIDWRLALWNRTWEEDRIEEHPTMVLTREWLWENRPIVDHVSLLHGDFRNGNFLFDQETGKITAILDWELCSLGDRHCDLGYTMLKAWGHAGPDGEFLNAGLLDTDTFIREYERISGLTIDRGRLHYYLVFAMYWSAIALYGTGLRNSEARLTHLDVMYNVIAGKGGFDIGELNRLVIEG